MKKKRNETRKQQANPKAGATYHPRSLYRGLGVEFSNKPGRKRIHPKPAGENVKGKSQRMGQKEG